jgi:tRNA threonylcarbamoyladenosine biosynthesis protein TsaE
MNNQQYTISDLTDLKDLVFNLVKNLPNKSDGATVVALSGDLGAGKTTLVQYLAIALGVTEVVTSPTFTIMKGYELPTGHSFERLIHMDAYRIDDLAELSPLRFNEILTTPKTLFCIEWAEKISAALPEAVIKIQINHTKGEEREVVVSWT